MRLSTTTKQKKVSRKCGWHNWMSDIVAVSANFHLNYQCSCRYGWLWLLLLLLCVASGFCVCLCFFFGGSLKCVWSNRNIYMTDTRHKTLWTLVSFCSKKITAKLINWNYKRMSETFFFVSSLSLFLDAVRRHSFSFVERRMKTKTSKFLFRINHCKKAEMNGRKREKKIRFHCGVREFNFVNGREKKFHQIDLFLIKTEIDCVSQRMSLVCSADDESLAQEFNCIIIVFATPRLMAPLTRRAFAFSCRMTVGETVKH